MTGLLSTCGLEFQDWSAEYRLFSRDRWPAVAIFAVVRRAILAQLPAEAPFAVASDDSRLRKTGIRIPGVGWRRDPLGPHLQTNFVRAQRVLQFSAALPSADDGARTVPILFQHAPTPAKPSRKASHEEQKQYRQAAQQARLPRLAAQQAVALRQALDAEPNGAPAPTPEQVRQDEAIPWTSLDVSLSGAPHTMRVKRLAPLLWRTAGLHHTLQLVVIAPVGYRLRKHSKLLYRQPAFLICTDPDLDVRALVQGYVRRWGIEVNFREEKTLLGVGEAQVRNAHSVEAVPALQVASYAMLLLATRRALSGALQPDLLPPPKWAPATRSGRFSTQRALHQLRAEVWARGLGLTNFSDFATYSTPVAKPEKFTPDLRSAVLYASN